MGREPSGQAGVAHASLYHSTHVGRRHAVARQLLCPANSRPKEWRLGASTVVYSRREVFVNESLQIVTSRDLPRFSALLGESKAELVAAIVKILAADLRDSADSGGCIDENGDDRPVS
jgi:hypothetical protein